jgi:RimJ/RimL family protein N-acetyltransferase
LNQVKIILETNRLILREFSLADTGFIIQLLNSPGWLQYIGDRHIHNHKDASLYIQNGPMTSYRQHGFGLYQVLLQHNLEPIGMCGLIKRELLDHPDLGFAFLPEYTGKGYAQESAVSVIKIAREMQLPVLQAITLAENNSSVSLLQKLGFSFDRLFRFQENEEELMLFNLSLQ